LPTERPLVRILWEQTGLPFQAHHLKVDVLHGTVNVLPVASRKTKVVTVHDLAFLRYPERFRRTKAEYLRVAVSRSVRNATRVIAVSQHTRRDIVDLLNVRPDQVAVVYQGIDSQFCPLPPMQIEQFRREKFDGRPYLLHVGTLEPRKNIDVLIRAFSRLRTRASIPHVLALAGARGWMYQNLFQLVEALGLEQHVHFAEYVSPEELPLWYNCADLFAYPSAYEGFGLPVLEAMACGLPVITTASSALKELAGDACLTVEPGSEEALEVALARVLEDTQLRRDLTVRGLARASTFSWRETAVGTVRVYEEAVEDARS
jgi:glycosyltransferase involved in cell wall biosynthesis